MQLACFHVPCLRVCYSGLESATTIAQIGLACELVVWVHGSMCQWGSFHHRVMLGPCHGEVGIDWPHSHWDISWADMPMWGVCGCMLHKLLVWRVQLVSFVILLLRDGATVL